MFAAINSVKKLKLTIRRNAPPLSFGLRVSPQDFNPLFFCSFALCLPPSDGSIFLRKLR
ncbi:unknown protein [Microcystis aeruginosa NIES-843]|uniref:Uncharacterized protein n=1 Tax=Microcystis aeruginosa (strain NIES-843 / IAM M-2473) TaxID=449447 RepID=B0JSH8_MICAN|nr:unknown protein [Microcystis aeruginosa NIES-843]